MSSADPQPIDALREAFQRATAVGPVVITSPTGSGKSTRVPLWCGGRVLVVQPRRLACRALATRVAEVTGATVGGAVGYSVRDEHRASEATRVLFATPGVALRMADGWKGFESVVLDEFHERSLDTDLLLALLAARFPGRLVVMSATLEGDRLAAHLRGVHLRGEARTFPVAVRYLSDGPARLPDGDRLEERVRRAVEASRGDPGDILVFLPGKGEITDCARALRNHEDLEVMALHGDMALEVQRRVFERGNRRRVVLATNVAETSLTLPRVGVVIDTGLVRQTRYRDGRASLVTVAVATDSADQRAGRAGRTAPGVCYRLWSAAARLNATTPPEVHRESLVPLVLAAAAWGERPEALPLLDPPRGHALAAARGELTALGAIDDQGALTPRGRELWGLPLDAHLGRLLVEARATGALEDVIDLVAALGTGRPMFLPGSELVAGEGLRGVGCDATALILAVRRGDPDTDGLHRGALDDARRTAARLRRAHGLPSTRGTDGDAVDRERIARTAIAADARCVHIARRRGREVAWSNGGTEVTLGRESALRMTREVEAIAVLDSRAVGEGRDAVVLVTCAMPVAITRLAALGLGHDRIAAVTVARGRAVATIERVYAGRVLAEREEVPEGDLAREAIATLFARGSVFRESLAVTTERLAGHALAGKLAAMGYAFEDGWHPPPPNDPPVGAPATVPGAGNGVGAWVQSRLVALGVTRGDDLAMLSPQDLLADDLPASVRASLDRDFPRTVRVGDATYDAHYDLAQRQVTLRMVRGARKDPPPLGYLPRFPGLRICVEAGRSMWIVRPAG